MLWLLLLFLVCGVGSASAQTIIGPVTCPSGAGNVITVPNGSNLNTIFNTNGEGKTYQLANGAYTLSSTIAMYQPPSGTTTCFVGTGSGWVTITMLTDRHFLPSNSQGNRPSLGLKGLTLQGGAGPLCGNSQNCGGIDAFRVTALGIEDVVFDSCQADVQGGALNVLTTSSLSTEVHIKNSRFVNNRARTGPGGGMLLTSDATGPTYPVTLDQVSFVGNEAADKGGGIDCLYCILTITGDSIFTDNTAHVVGGGFYYQDSSVTVSGPSVWTTNHAVGASDGVGSGGAGYVVDTLMRIDGTVTATGNTATWGCGALAAGENSGKITQVEIMGASNWTDNAAAGAGGGGMCAVVGAFIFVDGDVLAVGNSARYGGFVSSQEDGSIVQFTGANIWRSNTATVAGGAAYITGIGAGMQGFSAGSLCAQDNTASVAGGGGAIAVTQGGTLDVDTANVQLAGNTPDGVPLDSAISVPSVVFCNQNIVISPASFDVTGELCPCVNEGRCSCPPGFFWTSEQSLLQFCGRCACNANEGCCTAEGNVAANGTACSAKVVCQEDTLCDGESILCPVVNKPDQTKCPWDPIRRRDYDDYGYAQAQAQHNMVQDSTKVPAHEAAAWLTGTPQYDTQWPPCEHLGKCLDGHCALRFDHPACCFVAHDEDYKGYKDSRFDPYGAALQQGDSANKEAHTSSFGYWRSRDWYCWR